MSYEIGIDMGGTSTKIGLVRELEIVDKLEFETRIDKGVESFAALLSDKVNLLLDKNNLSKEDVESVGLGVPGNANRDTGMVEYANNLGFENVPFQKMLEERMGMPVVVDNDANLAALGEYALCNSHAKSFMMVTIGTGIGAGFIFNGEVYRGINFAEGEVGHMTIKYDGISCNCGRKGCFEAYASSNALVKMACDSMKRNINSSLWKNTKIDGKAFFAAISEGDKAMMMVLDEYTSILSEGLANIINIFQPEELVVGGGISAAADLFLPDTIDKVKAKIYSRNSSKNTVITAAKYGNDAGIIGAAKVR